MLHKIFFAILIGTIIGFFCSRMLTMRKIERRLNKVVRAFLANYILCKEIIESDYGMKEIMNLINPNGETQYEYVTLDFGPIKDIKFANSKELRQCFIMIGEEILSYERNLSEQFGVECDVENSYYGNFLQILKAIRIECMQKNENAYVT